MSGVQRKDCLLKGGASCQFKVAENPSADGSEPLYEIPLFSTVSRYLALIERVSRELAVDARLIKSIMYMETTHGYYDTLFSIFDANKSILPMNVNVRFWGSSFGSREDLKDPYKNIRAGTEILKRIIQGLPRSASVRQIATLYNNINAQKVSDYGARVDWIYSEQPWLK